MLLPDLVAKLNDCANHDFVSTRDFWFLWLSRGTRIVAGGLLLEAGELWYDLRSFLRDRISSLKYRTVILEHRVQIAKMIAHVGWILIVGGVVTEWASEVRVKDADANIQECSDVQLAELTQENTEAKKALEVTFMRTRPRIMYDNQTFQVALKGKPKADVEILFKPEDDEAYTFAGQIKARLTDTRPGLGAGWTVSVFCPLRQSDALPNHPLNRPGVPLATKSGAWWGLGLVVKSAPYPCFDHENDSPVCALQAALTASGVGAPSIALDPRMPDNEIKIIIGQEQSGH